MFSVIAESSLVLNTFHICSTCRFGVFWSLVLMLLTCCLSASPLAFCIVIFDGLVDGLRMV